MEKRGYQCSCGAIFDPEPDGRTFTERMCELLEHWEKDHTLQIVKWDE